MSKVYIFLADGFEEIEAISVIDILRRGDVNIKTVSISGDNHIKGAHGVTFVADTAYEENDYSGAAMLILPGGMPGTKHLSEHKELKALLMKQYLAGGYIGAICAAPSILGDLGLLKNRVATCYPGFESHLSDAKYSTDDIEISDHIITSRGPAFAMNFGLMLLELLKGKPVSDSVAKGLLVIQ